MTKNIIINIAANMNTNNENNTMNNTTDENTMNNTTVITSDMIQNNEEIKQDASDLRKLTAQSNKEAGVKMSGFSGVEIDEISISSGAFYGRFLSVFINPGRFYENIEEIRQTIKNTPAEKLMERDGKKGADENTTTRDQRNALNRKKKMVERHMAAVRHEEFFGADVEWYFIDGDLKKFIMVNDTHITVYHIISCSQEIKMGKKALDIMTAYEQFVEFCTPINEIWQISMKIRSEKRLKKMRSVVYDANSDAAMKFRYMTVRAGHAKNRAHNTAVRASRLHDRMISESFERTQWGTELALVDSISDEGMYFPDADMMGISDKALRSLLTMENPALGMTAMPADEIDKLLQENRERRKARRSLKKKTQGLSESEHICPDDIRALMDLDLSHLDEFNPSDEEIDREIELACQRRAGHDIDSFYDESAIQMSLRERAGIETDTVAHQPEMNFFARQDEKRRGLNGQSPALRDAQIREAKKRDASAALIYAQGEREAAKAAGEQLLQEFGSDAVAQEVEQASPEKKISKKALLASLRRKREASVEEFAASAVMGNSNKREVVFQPVEEQMSYMDRLRRALQQK